jgi:hypothetical protein
LENYQHTESVKDPAPVKFITAITFTIQEILTDAVNVLEKQFGDLESQSVVYDFNHSDYYESEMGPNLQKQFFSFNELIAMDQLVSRKRFTIELEKQFSINGKRRVNIDPAYLELSKLVVATTKNYDHRIYLGQGIYGDVQLRFRNGKFVTNDWTYPDYNSLPVISFLTNVRNLYFCQLRVIK